MIKYLTFYLTKFKTKILYFQLTKLDSYLTDLGHFLSKSFRLSLVKS